jgi:GDSL-like Lipase/Acylhydrolase
MVGRTVLCVVGTALIVMPAMGASARSGVNYPSSIVALGHSGSTGYNSDARHPGTDAHQNSWSTGSNPAVNSLYRRILSRNPAIKGHNVNLAEDGSKVDELVFQAQDAVKLKPQPGLVTIMTVDNDIRCDGSDSSNYGPFAAKLARTLKIINEGATKARILLVSSPWSTPEQYAAAISSDPALVRDNSGSGKCDLFYADGKPAPANRRYLQKIINGYYAVLARTCARAARCVYDRGALGHLAINLREMTNDHGHLSIAGHRKVAALEWSVLY